MGFYWGPCLPLSDGVASVVACPLGLGSRPGGVFLRLSLYCECDKRLLSIPSWAGHSFIIHHVVVHNRLPAVCGIKRLAITEALLLVENSSGVIFPPRGILWSRLWLQILKVASLYSHLLIFWPL